MYNQSANSLLSQLAELRYPYIVEKKLRYYLENTKKSKNPNPKVCYPCYTRFLKYKVLINRLEKIRNDRGVKKSVLGISPLSIKSKKKIKNLAHRISIYFSQGYEMYKTTLNMNILSSPIIEYYSLLQIAKGSILLELDVENTNFIEYHGLTKNRKKSEDSVHCTKLLTRGVFPALLIRSTDYYKREDGTKEFLLDGYYSGFFPKFEDIVQERKFKTIPDTFIFSWMLSEVVRYKPEVWREISSGKDNEWIKTINEFRDYWLPHTMLRLIQGICV